MAEFLATLARHVRAAVERRRRETPLSALRDRRIFHAPARGFAAALTGNCRRIIAEIKRNLVPQMTLTGTCQNSDGDARQVGAVIRFTDSKPGKAFGFPLIADATPK